MEHNAGVKHVDDQHFRTAVLESVKPVLVDFWAPWCGPCRAIGPILEELAGEYGPRVDVVKVNIDDNPKTALQYGVRSIPTLLFIKDGEVRESKIGLAPKPELVAMIDRQLQNGSGR